MGGYVSLGSEKNQLLPSHFGSQLGATTNFLTFGRRDYKKAHLSLQISSPIALIDYKKAHLALQISSPRLQISSPKIAETGAGIGFERSPSC
jgi:hypothetical protein